MDVMRQAIYCMRPYLRFICLVIKRRILDQWDFKVDGYMQENQATDGIFNAFDCENMLGRPCSFLLLFFYTEQKS